MKGTFESAPLLSPLLITFTHHLYSHLYSSPLLITFTHDLYSHLYSLTPVWFALSLLQLVPHGVVPQLALDVLLSSSCLPSSSVTKNDHSPCFGVWRPQPVLWRVWRWFRLRQRGTLAFCLISSDAKEHIRDNPTHSSFLFNVLRW